MEKKYNLKRSLEKRAFYESVRGYWNTQRRCWMNCYKAKSDLGQGAQDAWMNCLQEYQSCPSNASWSLDYSGQSDTANKPYEDAKTPFAQKIASTERTKYDVELARAAKKSENLKKIVKDTLDDLENSEYENSIN